MKVKQTSEKDFHSNTDSKIGGQKLTGKKLIVFPFTLLHSKFDQVKFAMVRALERWDRTTAYGKKVVHFSMAMFLGLSFFIMLMIIDLNKKYEAPPTLHTSQKTRKVKNNKIVFTKEDIEMIDKLTQHALHN